MPEGKEACLQGSGGMCGKMLAQNHVLPFRPLSCRHSLYVLVIMHKKAPARSMEVNQATMLCKIHCMRCAGQEAHK